LPERKPAITDTDILNFALNLEYLEAEYYTIATSGMTIDQMGIGITGTGTQGGVTIKNNAPASAIVPFTTPAFQSYAQETAGEERKHVSFLRNALGTSAVAQPAIDLLNKGETRQKCVHVRIPADMTFVGWRV
jgi:Ferritin-like domain